MFRKKFRFGYGINGFLGKNQALIKEKFLYLKNPLPFINVKP